MHDSAATLVMLPSSCHDQHHPSHHFVSFFSGYWLTFYRVQCLQRLPKALQGRELHGPAARSGSIWWSRTRSSTVSTSSRHSSWQGLTLGFFQRKSTSVTKSPMSSSHFADKSMLPEVGRLQVRWKVCTGSGHLAGCLSMATRCVLYFACLRIHLQLINAHYSPCPTTGRTSKTTWRTTTRPSEFRQWGVPATHTNCIRSLLAFILPVFDV